MTTASNIKRNKHGHIIEEYARPPGVASNPLVGAGANGTKYNERALRYYKIQRKGAWVHRVIVDFYLHGDRDNRESTIIYEGPSLEMARKHWQYARECWMKTWDCVRID